MRQPILELPLIHSLILPLKFTSDHIVLKSASVGALSSFQLFILSDLSVLKEVPFEVLLIANIKFSSSVHHSIFELTFINSAVTPFKHSLTLFFTIMKLPLITITVRKLLPSLSRRNSFQPLSFVDRPQSRNKNSSTLEQRFTERSSVV